MVAGVYSSLAFLSSTPKAKAKEAAGIARRGVLAAMAGGVLGVAGLEVQDVSAEGRRIGYPPIDRKDKFRCKWQDSKMGQANAARDKYFDVRECKMAGSNAAGKDIAGVLMNDGDFRNVSFVDITMSKAQAENAKFDNADFTNGVVDRVNFKGASLRNVIFKNTLLTGSRFEDADLEGADFTEASIDQSGIRPLCNNPTMKGTNPVTGADTWESAVCMIKSFGR